MNRPNILYIHSHDTGRYVQPYGHAIPTPNIQRLAEQGVLFRQNFCAGPTCSPSRASLLTGQCAHSSGMIGLAHRGFSLKDYKQHIVHTLRKVGYHSALSGVQHVARNAEIIGYDQILTTQGGKAAQTAVDFLDNAPPQPFFLSVGFGVTHRKFPEPGPDEDDRYCLPPTPLPDTPETRRDMAAFKASARILDQNIGVVLESLDKNGLSKNTLVICTTDHGIAFPGMKCNLTDHGIGVMLIMRGPGGFTGGQVCDAMVSHINVFPTICDLLEIEHPQWLQGESMMPLIRGEADEINEEIFSDEQALIEFLLDNHEEYASYIGYLIELHGDMLMEVLMMREMTAEELGLDMETVFRFLRLYDDGKVLESMSKLYGDEQVLRESARRLGEEQAMKELMQMIGEERAVKGLMQAIGEERAMKRLMQTISKERLRQMMKQLISEEPDNNDE